MWIVGMMGSGKSTAGRLSAQNLNIRFSDTDDVVVERMGCSIAQFWGERGEAAFREIEKVAMNSVAERGGVKVTGGGVVLDESNRAILREASKVVWLKAAPETLAQRLIGHQNRPLLAGDESSQVEGLAQTLTRRADLYDEVATYHVETDVLDVPDVASALEDIWRI
jgi:shikimate kinase